MREGTQSANILAEEVIYLNFISYGDEQLSLIEACHLLEFN